MKYLGPPQSGSIAGQTASRNRFGQYLRNRRAPVQPRSPAQLLVRGFLTANAKAWGDLTDAQRNAWKAFASAHPTVDSLGSSVTLTGAMVYVAVNGLNLSAGLAVQTAPPDGAGVATPGLTVDSGTALAFNLSSTDAVDGELLVYSSPPLSAGVSFTNDFRLVTVTSSPGATDDACTKAQLEAKWGTLIAGQKFIFRARTLNAGNISAYTTASVVLT